MNYQVGDRVIHRSLGLCEIVAVEQLEYQGMQASPYYKIQGEEMTTWVPVVENENSSLRVPVRPEELDEYRAILSAPANPMEPNSYKRQPGINARLKINTFQAQCELYRDLAALKNGHSLSVTEKDILQRLRTRLVAEWAAAAQVTERKAGDEIDSLVKSAG